MLAAIFLNGHGSTFKQIEELSQKLLAKNAVARFADKGKDSKVVVGLIERLREAIVYYQVSDYHSSTPGTIDRGTDIATASDLLSNHSSHGKTPAPLFPQG